MQPLSSESVECSMMLDHSAAAVAQMVAGPVQGWLRGGCTPACTGTCVLICLARSCLSWTSLSFRMQWGAAHMTKGASAPIQRQALVAQSLMAACICNSIAFASQACCNCGQSEEEEEDCSHCWQPTRLNEWKNGLPRLVAAVDSLSSS